MKRRVFLLIAVMSMAIALLPAGANAKTKNRVTGTLTALGGTTAPTTIVVLSGGTDYTFNVTVKTVLQRKFFGTSSLEEFMVGDALDVTFVPSSATVATQVPQDALKIRNTSIQRRGGTIKGIVSDIDCVAGTFVLTPTKRVAQTVILNANTTIIRYGQKLTCADIQKGESATVIGVWRPSLHQITADRVILKASKITGKISTITLTNGGLPATITIKRNDALTASNKNAKTQVWTINVTEATRLLKKNLKMALITDFHVGDTIQAIGVAQPIRTLDAIVLRLLSKAPTSSSAK